MKDLQIWIHRSQMNLTELNMDVYKLNESNGKIFLEF